MPLCVGSGANPPDRPYLAGQEERMKRQEAVAAIMACADGEHMVVSATGMTSREMYTLRDSDRNLYMIGVTGLASAVGLGLALSVPHRQIAVIDQDGSVRRSRQALPVIGRLAPPNLLHLVLARSGRRRALAGLDVAAAEAGYRRVENVARAEDLRRAIAESRGRGPAFVLVRIEDSGPGAGTDISRPGGDGRSLLGKTTVESEF